MVWINVTQISYAQILNDVTKIKIEKGKKIKERTIKIQVNSKESNWLSKIEIDHKPSEEFSLIQAKIIDSEGSIVRKLKKKEIKTKNKLSYSAFYQDNLVEEFSLYWNNYPYQIEYSYRLVNKEYVYVTKWQPLVHSNMTTLKSSLQVEIPIEYEVHLDSSSELQFEVLISDNKKVFKWSIDLIKPNKPQIYAPPLEELMPRVSIVPINFNYGVQGSTESWTSFGTWYIELNKGMDLLPISERVIVNKLVEGIKNKQEIIKKLYQYLQDRTKYINVSIDVGGLKSYPASYVCQNKYGDCKALTTYMKAMLNHLSIESYYTLINSGINATKVNVNMPAQQFNHVILTIPLENDTIWLENTSNSSPFNYLGTFTQNRYALMVKSTTSKLVLTPRLKASDVMEKRTFNFDFTDSRISQVSILKDLRGKAFESYMYYKTQTSLKEQKEIILSELLIDDFEIIEWNIINTKRDNKHINISVIGNCTSQIRKIGELKVIKPLKINIPKFEEPQKRKLGIRINYPINKSDSIIYYLPNLSHYETQLPENIELVTKYGKYKVTYKSIKDNLFIHELFLLNSGEYPIEEYSIFYSFINEINNHKTKSSIILK